MYARFACGHASPQGQKKLSTEGAMDKSRDLKNTLRNLVVTQRNDTLICLCVHARVFDSTGSDRSFIYPLAVFSSLFLPSTTTLSLFFIFASSFVWKPAILRVLISDASHKYSYPALFLSLHRVPTPRSIPICRLSLTDLACAF